MKHTLRKFISCRGSALFMVLSTMTAILIAVMAMYFSVVSSRSVQYAVYNQEQSYQSALSLQNAMIGGFNDGTMNDILAVITDDKNFKVGDTYATTRAGNDADQQNGVGTYELSITRVEDEDVNGTTALTYDVATTVEVNGILETTHIFYHIFPQIEESTLGNSQIFAATGYVPNNVDVTSGKFATTSSFDNELVNIGNGTTEYFLCGNFYCGGSLAIYKANNPSDKVKQPIDMVVRDTLYLYNIDASLYFAPQNSTDGNGNVYVGKDVYINGSFKLNADNMYIIGDLYYDGKGNVNDGGKIHVDGNVYWKGGNMPKTSWLECNGKVYDASGNERSGYSKWADDSAKAAVDYIDSSTKSSAYKAWELPNTGYTNREIHFNSKNNEYVQTIDFSGGADKKCYTQIQTIKDDEINTSILRNYTLFIDTGDDPENIHYINIKANCSATESIASRTTCSRSDYDGFTWYPVTNGSTGLPSDDSQKNMNILVRGRGSVIINVPEGVTYLPSPYEKFMHESWAYLASGGNIVKSEGGKPYYQVEVRNHSDNVRKLIHTNCKDGCTSCSYNVVKSTTEKCEKCGNYMTTITCDNHNYKLTCCTNTSCEMCNEPKKKNGNYYGLCENRIDRLQVDAFALAKGITLPTDSQGTVYPNNNIFLVSCDESAEIYISDYAKVYGNGNVYEETVNACTFFGFIYAPYMTFKGTHAAEENTVRFCGGMVVSDYIFGDNSWYMSCYPDLMPEQLGAKNNLPPPDKRWKVKVARN